MKDGPTKGHRNEKEREYVKSERRHEAGGGAVDMIEGRCVFKKSAMAEGGFAAPGDHESARDGEFSSLL
jgi:hypothetical protein